MSRVEKELASLAPWAWDPLVARHAPGSAMMRDFSEVVADKAVTGGNARAYRFKSPDLASTPARPTDRPSSSAATPTATDAGKATGVPTSSSREEEDLGAPPLTAARDDANAAIRVGKRTRSSPASRAGTDATPAPATAARGTPVPPARAAASSARATPFKLASKPTRAPHRLNDGSSAPDHRRGQARDGNDAAPVVTNLVKALDEAGDEEPRRVRRRGDAKTSAKKTREKEAKEAKEAKDAAKRAAAAAKRKAQREERDRERAAERAEKENRRPSHEPAVAARAPPSAGARTDPPGRGVRSRELAGLDPVSGPDARRQREAALLAVAAVEAAAEAEAAEPRATSAQTLLAAFYDMTGREPPPGLRLHSYDDDAPSASETLRELRERAKRAADARDVAVYGAVYEPPPPPRMMSGVGGGGGGWWSAESSRWHPVCIGPFGGAAGREDFAAAYHGAPARVVSAGAQLARACEYLGRVDAVDADRRAASVRGGGARDGEA